MAGRNKAMTSSVKVRTLILGVLLHVGTAWANLSMADVGVVRGVVFNGSRDKQPVAGAQVALRARIQGQFTVVEETTTNSRGSFQFKDLPVDAEIQYIAGANRDEVHYPGPRLRLTNENSTSEVEIVVYESSTEPNPLVIRQHDIVLQLGAGATEVTETILLDNPSDFCYVGQTTSKPDRVVTLRLSIPPDFERVTFEKEFFGRRFLLIDGKLLTGIAWPPGERQLKFTYVVPNDNNDADWHRPVDLPCSSLRLSVLTNQPDHVRCNLESVRSLSADAVTFTTTGSTLPTGHEIQLHFGRVPVPMIVYGRWVASAVLVTLIGGTSILLCWPKWGRRGTR